MSKERIGRRDDLIEALHALVLAGRPPDGRGGRPSWWAFASQTADGTWIVTYKAGATSPGEGWKLIPWERIDSARADIVGGAYVIRVGAPS